MRISLHGTEYDVVVNPQVAPGVVAVRDEPTLIRLLGEASLVNYLLRNGMPTKQAIVQPPRRPAKTPSGRATICGVPRADARAALKAHGHKLTATDRAVLRSRLTANPASIEVAAKRYKLSTWTVQLISERALRALGLRPTTHYVYKSHGNHA